MVVTIADHLRLLVRTSKKLDIVNITPQVQTYVSETAQHSEGNTGFVNLFNQHTTSGLWLNEQEDGVLEDLIRTLERFAPTGIKYAHHHDNGQPPNGWSHVASILLRQNLQIPVLDGEMALGEHQQIFYVELDGPKQRRVILQAVYQ